MSYSEHFTNKREGFDLLLCCREKKNACSPEEMSQEKLFFLLLISFDNSVSGGIVGLLIGSAICSSSLSWFLPRSLLSRSLRSV